MENVSQAPFNPYLVQPNSQQLTGTEYFRFIHDKQMKVCRLCIKPGHILRGCPEFVCHRCRGQGHYARECKDKTADKCTLCHNSKSSCICNESNDDDDDSTMFGLVPESVCSTDAGSEGEEERLISNTEGVNIPAEVKPAEEKSENGTAGL